MKLIIGNRNYSSWSLRAWLILKHYELEFTEQVLPLFEPDFKQRILAISDVGKVPVLIDGENCIWDSLSICEYVNDTKLSGKALPKDASQRAVARSCIAEMHSSFFEIRTLLPMNCRATDRKVEPTVQLLSEIQRVEEMWSKFRSLNASKEWLFGDFSIADCFFAPLAFRFQTYGIQLNSVANEYKQALLNHKHMIEWLALAREEEWVSEKFEVGL